MFLTKIFYKNYQISWLRYDQWAQLALIFWKFEVSWQLWFALLLIIILLYIIIYTIIIYYNYYTSNNSFIQFYFGHRDNIKYSVFISIFLRALRVFSQEYYINKIKYIFKIGNDLKFPTTFLKRSLSKAKSIFSKTDNQKP